MSRVRVAQLLHTNPGLYRRRRLLVSARQRAKEEGAPCTLRISDIDIPATCPVFGTPLQSGARVACPQSPSIDRLVPVLGYVPGNVRVISCRANTLKQNIDAEQWRKLSTYMLRYGALSREDFAAVLAAVPPPPPEDPGFMD
jgi:hypothetical protein